MRRTLWPRLFAAALCWSVGMDVWAQSETQGAATSAPAAAQGAGDLRDALRELKARLEALETQHARERESDQRRIAELEATVAELGGRTLEAERRQALLEQIAAAADSMPSGSPTVPSTSMPASPEAGGAEAELEALLSGAAPAPPARGGGTTTGGAIGQLQSAIQSFNPEISLNGDLLMAYSNREGGELDDEFLFRELEIGFAGAVDPYSRADVIATIAREDGEYVIELEEAYLTFLQLPYDLQARLGKYRAEFGRANPIHLHALPWIDYPFVIRRYFGEEGLSGTGGEISWLIPNPWKQYASLTYEVFNNDNDVLFAGEDSDDFTHLARLKTFRELNAESTLELGASFATAPNDSGHGSHRSMIEGADLTFRWKPKAEGLYRSFLWQNEVMFAQADLRNGQETTWGMYSAVDYQFARRWKIGARYDNAQLPFSSSRFERGYSAYLTFLQSEFLYWRLGYLYTDRNFAVDGNRDDHQLFVQLNFTLGAHPGHKY